mmetsp:Transcript_11732/g.13278  ORF Transcript_11732/g.13278 Transcript_11732/m.13278 type:complete len:204 (+) Transcript_11732:143-754(+)
MFEDIPIEPRLTNFLLKCMVSQDFQVEDFMTYDQSLSSSFSYIKNNVINQNELGMNFTVQDKEDGIVELIKDGADIKVNNYTKHAYINLFLEYHGYHKSHKQIEAFLEGLYEVVPKKLLNLLTVEDLKNYLVGSSVIDINDWQMYTNYTGDDANVNHPTVNSFWKIISDLEQKHLKKFLQFCTGCRSVPIDGFRSLKNNRQEE